MSIASEISRVQGAIADAYDACEAKGATMPTTENIAALADCIESIPSGGGAAPIEYKAVNLVDFDGTFIASYTKDEFLALTEYPTIEHEGLTLLGWTYGLAYMKEYITKYPHSMVVDIARFVNTDGIRIVFDTTNANQPASVRPAQSTYNYYVDWGDGTTEHFTASGNKTHQYATAGKYVVRVTSANNFTGLNISAWANSSARAIEVYLPSGCAFVSEGQFSLYQAEKVAAENLPNGCSTKSLCESSAATRTFAAGWSMLRFLAFRPNTTTIRQYSYRYSYGLHLITLPEGLTSIGSTFNCDLLYSLTIPEGITTLSSGYWGGGNLRQISIPSTITSIAANTFGANQCCNDVYLYIRDASTCALGHTNAFTSLKMCTFHIPQGSLASYQAATNWSTLTASYNFVEDL